MRRVVTDAACQEAVCVLTGELLGVSRRIWMWRTIGVTFKRDGRHRDGRTCGELLLQLVVLRFAFGEAKPPPVVMDARLT